MLLRYQSTTEVFIHLHLIKSTNYNQVEQVK